MVSQSTVNLYHGTDWESALDILNHGLNIDHLKHLQAGRATQLGIGWYTTDMIDTAWYFASIAPGITEGGYTVIQMILHLEHLESLLEQELAVKDRIINVPFQGVQYWFRPNSFDFLNKQALFSPYHEGV